MTETIPITLREAFVARFSEEQAERIEKAAIGHRSSDPADPHAGDQWSFEYLFGVAIGFECLSNDGYRAAHGITIPVAELKQWALDTRAIDKIDVPDYLGLMAGMYNGWWREAEDDE